MTPSRFARLLDTHGPHPERWPAARRAGSAALLATSAEAKALLAAAQSLDARLGTDLPHPASDAVVRLRAAVAWQIARTPLPAASSPWTRVWELLRPAVPAGWGALAAMATCALWLSLAAAPAIGDPLAPLQALPIAEDPL